MFIDEYRECLTVEGKNENYKNKILKEDCYVRLTEILEVTDPAASVANTKQKQNSFTFAYSRELKKVEASKKNWELNRRKFISSPCGIVTNFIFLATRKRQ